MTKISVYIPTHNYGHYLETAVNSVIKQTMKDWELIIIDDGSTDNTQEVLAKYKNHPQIFIVQQENRGLNVSNNVAIRLARGEYIMRLDADDWLDENCLLVLSNVLDQRSDVGLVYPDYYHVDGNGEVLEIIRRKKIGEEVELLDLPAHGACSMIRKQVLLSLGSYSEEFTCQDGYDLWIKLIQKYKPYNVNLPLFYYRRHGNNLTLKEKKIIDTRQAIKKSFLDSNTDLKRPNVMAIIPVISTSIYSQNRPFVMLQGQPLIWHTLTQAVNAVSLNKIVVAADEDATLQYVRQNFPQVDTFKREGHLSAATVKLVELVLGVTDFYQKTQQYVPDSVCMLYISTPLRRAQHIDHAVDTMTIFGTDSVISVTEELAPCYHHERHGLYPINMQNETARLERKAIYKENGAIFLSKLPTIKQNRLLGEKIGHVAMLPEESVKLNTDFEFWLAERILEERKNGQAT